MKQTFREWLKENENKSINQDIKSIKQHLCIFESFNTYYDIEKIGFEKRDNFFSNRWKITGFEKELKNGEIQKLFSTVIYVINKLYKENFSYIFIYSEEVKKFDLYLRIIKQIHEKLLPGSIIQYEINTILISKKDATSLDVQEIETKYIKQKLKKYTHESISTTTNKLKIINMSLYIITYK